MAVNGIVVPIIVVIIITIIDAAASLGPIRWFISRMHPHEGIISLVLDISTVTAYLLNWRLSLMSTTNCILSFVTSCNSQAVNVMLANHDFGTLILICLFGVQGIGNHKRICKQKFDQHSLDSQIHNELERQTSRATTSTFTPMDFERSVDFNYSAELESQHFQESDGMSTLADNEFSEATTLILNSIDHINLTDGNIITQYHPSAILDPQIVPLREYLASSTSKPASVFDSCPWYPFSSQLHFDLAEFILCTGMNHQAQNDFFSIIDRCGGNKSTEYTIRNENDLAEAWSHAENRFTKFKKETISVPYKDELRNHDVHYRPLWDWTLDLLNDKDLAPHFVWDAVQLFREDKNGNTFWEIQSSLPPGGKPLAYILYADKSCLSSFGTAKGYPVMAWCGNLPDEIRNGKNFCGGCVVGWLPIVEEEEDHKGKPSWINFKRVVWHEAFCKILGSVTQYSHSGYAFQLPNSEKIMKSKSMKEIYERACLLSAAKAEDLLKSYGLRKVPNVFWEIERSDPYHAVSWDRLHAFLIGLFDHLLRRLIEHIDRLPGRQAKIIVDEVIKSFPQWRNLTHFTFVFSFDFGDGKKYEHMSRQILFAAQAVLTKAADPAELDVYAAMDVHMENTIKEGQSIMQVFGERMQAYIKATVDSRFKTPTTWDIPKMHTQKHLFSDIQAKGVTKNYNTKINESMHGPLKKAYQTQTNFKNVAEQILRTDHQYNVAMQIQQGID
ncbi:hypothetical protein EDD85DRAFT_792978 [Armillaria nabsnona]|nr:hypothetical protein EDD85DRAFT_792978 [Armillaria nabsnona]